ncbi:PEP/pyruvate-binding domain-containing protein [Methylocaldum marinum]|uniref:PEP/pyruvate-binding domain-containing protein n=1 Tax=Methylocaldum marinum TaxID=1432792 RepID=UPI000E689B9A
MTPRVLPRRSNPRSPSWLKFPRAVRIDANWGLGETVVQGTVDPDAYAVFKPLLKQEAYRPIIDKTIGRKAEKVIHRVLSVAWHVGDRDVVLPAVIHGDVVKPGRARGDQLRASSCPRTSPPRSE